MAIIQRRIFFGNVGTADQLVQHLREGNESLAKYGASFASRILTDYMSGRTDRVAVEWEAQDLGEIDAAMNRAMTDPQGQAFFGQWFQRLAELIYSAEVEHWSVR